MDLALNILRRLTCKQKNFVAIPNCSINEANKLHSKKYKGGHRFTISQEKINYFMADTNIFTKNEELGLKLIIKIFSKIPVHSLVWFGLVIWHINQCWLFNAKSFLNTQIYILNIWSLNTLCRKHFFNQAELIFCTQLNDFIYFYVITIILFIINHLFTHS